MLDRHVVGDLCDEQWGEWDDAGVFFGLEVYALGAVQRLKEVAC